jgi:hypothetical protein
MFVCSDKYYIYMCVPLYAITNKTNKNVQRPHVFLYFSESVAGTIAGSVVGGLIDIGIIVTLIVYCARKSTVAILLQVV